MSRVLVDSIVATLVIYASIELRLLDAPGVEFPLRWLEILAVAIVVKVSVYTFAGLYRSVNYYAGLTLIGSVCVAEAVVVGGQFIAIGLLQISEFPRSVPFIYFIISCPASILFRLAPNYLKVVSHSLGESSERRRALVYGAGRAGAWFHRDQRINGGLDVCGFIDDDPALWGRKIGGREVLSPEEVPAFIKKNRPEVVVVAAPSVSSIARKKMLHNIASWKLEGVSLPSYDEISNGAPISMLKEISADDLLGRDPVPLETNEIEVALSSKAVLITGAGGTIGGALVKKLSAFDDLELIAVERSELALYNLRSELAELHQGAGVRFVLGDCLDRSFLDWLFDSHKVNVVIHAAAYKHVSIVEENSVSAFKNNVFATQALLQAFGSSRYSEKFLLVSSDKAVRPPNVMGASKRVCELLVRQASQQYQEQGKKFGVVRFGNVLESSGSVVPRFKEQIRNGGPVTVTDKMVQRYFMTIDEASSLILHSLLLSNLGEIFLLDMGSPVLVDDLARQLIRLSGKPVCDESSSGRGCIEIQYIGLGAGEKLVEELIIEGNVQPTIKKKIYVAPEAGVDDVALFEFLDSLTQLDFSMDVQLKKMIKTIVSEYSGG